MASKYTGPCETSLALVAISVVKSSSQSRVQDIGHAERGLTSQSLNKGVSLGDRLYVIFFCMMLLLLLLLRVDTGKLSRTASLEGFDRSRF